jgi:Ca-activated chloride channel family protein
MSQEPANLYQVLSVDRQATAEEIEAAYFGLRASARGNAAEPAGERIQYAYDVLSDPQRRSLYDSLLAETSAPSLTVEVIPSRDRLVISDTPQLLYLLVHVRPREADEQHIQPLNLCLVLDRSTSMRGERLDKVMAAVRLIMAKLGPADVLSVVSFSDRAEVVLPATTIGLLVSQTGRSKEEEVGTVLGRMVASGGTEIYHGLSTGVAQMRQLALAHYTNHLILLTDGHTYGDAANCLALAHQAAAEGIGFSAFGIGADWNDQFLDALVTPSGGQSGYIDKPAEIITYLENRIRGLGNVYAYDVQLQANWPQQVTALECFKLSPFAQPLSLKSDRVALGQLEGRAPLSFLLELQISPQSIPARIKIPLTIIATVPTDDNNNPHEQTLTSFVQLFVTGLADVIDAQSDEPPDGLIEAVRLLTLHRMHEKAWADAEAGQIRSAATRMHQLTTRLLESGELELARLAHQEAQRIARLGTMSLEGHKALKYGTRSLLGQRRR